MNIENNILRYYLRNVWFITGTAYAGKSTTVRMLAERYDACANSGFFTVIRADDGTDTREAVCERIAKHFGLVSSAGADLF